jgi:catechol 2,3-dioxygenase-like lactoylglutathione lyase family enzyme
MTTRLFRVIVPVSDIDRAAAFYTEVLALEGQRVSPGRHYFDCGGTILACFDPRADTDDFDAQPNPDHLYFAVDDLEACLDRARRAGCEDLGEIATRPWGERSFYGRDPFGNPICFVDVRTTFAGEWPEGAGPS